MIFSLFFFLGGGGEGICFIRKYFMCISKYTCRERAREKTKITRPVHLMPSNAKVPVPSIVSLVVVDPIATWPRRYARTRHLG